MRRFKDRIGAAIADWLGQRVEPEMAPHRRATLASARGRVLEVGTGTGFNVAYYPDAVEAIVLTDPGVELLRRAERRAFAAGRRVELVRAFAEELPFDDDSFDTVVSTLVLCSVRDQDRALMGIRRVLKPDGVFLFMEHVRADDARQARWQDRLERPWQVVAMGCHPNRATLERIEAAGFHVHDLQRGRLPKSLPIVRPLITGRAAVQG